MAVSWIVVLGQMIVFLMPDNLDGPLFPIINYELYFRFIANLGSCKLTSRRAWIKNSPALCWFVLPPSFAIKIQNDASLNLGCRNCVLIWLKVRKIHAGAVAERLKLTCGGQREKVSM
jgi:hypothetical protein